MVAKLVYNNRSIAVYVTKEDVGELLSTGYIDLHCYNRADLLSIEQAYLHIEPATRSTLKVIMEREQEIDAQVAAGAVQEEPAPEQDEEGENAQDA